jgi:glycosyltransferase involved in cell wall biosynthesis
MRIGIDAREITGRPTGVGRYLRGLLTEWAASEQARRHEFVLYAHEALPVMLDARRFATRLVAGSGGSWWEQISLPAAMSRDHLDAFFSPGYTLPLRAHVPAVVAIHDISFAVHPEWFGAREGARLRWLTRRAALSARAVVTISEFTRGELCDVYRMPADRVHVVPPGVTAPLVSSGARAGGPTVLFVGSIFNRRHIPDLIRAFSPIARVRPDTSLEIVGDNRSRPFQDVTRLITAAGLTGRARWRPWVPDQELGGLYSTARAFAFLSEYEGLGLTPLEAIAVGIPPLLLDTPVARESCVDAALYVPSGDISAATTALERLLFDDDVRRRLLNAAPGVLQRYSWPRAAADTLAVIERAA